MTSTTKRFLIGVWHVWGFWTVVVTLASVRAPKEVSRAILALAAGIWVFGLARAIVRREPTVLLRVTGLGILGLALFLGHCAWPPNLEHFDFKEHGGAPAGWRLLAMVSGSGMVILAMSAVAYAGIAWIVARLTRKERPDQTRTGRVWVRQAVIFPVTILVTLLLAQFLFWLPGLALALWAVIWLWHFLRDAYGGRPIRLRLAGLGLALLLLAGWPPVSLDATRDDIAEAVFRHQLFGCESGTFYLGLDGRDPSEEFLRRFADLPVQIKAVSKAQVPRWEGERFSQHNVTDKETGEVGWIFSVASVGRSSVNPCAVAVKGGYYGGDLASAGSTYWVAWLAGRWVVVDQITHWVS